MKLPDETVDTVSRKATTEDNDELLILPCHSEASVSKLMNKYISRDQNIAS